MAYVPGFAFDVFVSFAHADNQPFGRRPAWVTAFVKELNTYLQLYCRNKCSIFFDPQGTVRIGKPLAHELAQNAGNSATFIPVTSPNYVDPESWGLDELKAFAEAGRNGQRIFPIELLPLEGRRQYPPPIDGLTRHIFWSHMDDLVPFMMSPKTATGERKIIGLGRQVQLHLQEMRNLLNGDSNSNSEAASARKQQTSHEIRS
jgi:TIR domain